MSSGLGSTPPAKNSTPKRMPRIGSSEAENGSLVTTSGSIIRFSLPLVVLDRDARGHQRQAVDRRLVAARLQRRRLELHQQRLPDLPGDHRRAGLVAQADADRLALVRLQPG